MNPNENAMFGAINEARTRRGLSPLQSDARLVQAARLHAEDMAAGRVNLDNSHIGPDGSTVVQRVGRQGLDGCRRGRSRRKKEGASVAVGRATWVTRGRGRRCG